MQLTHAQLEQFDRDGYLFFPSLFTPEEIQVLLDEAPRLYAQSRPENVREKGSDAVCTNFAAHMYSKLRDYDVPLPWQDGTPEAALQPILAS